jgi:hypothetical protein
MRGFKRYISAAAALLGLASSAQMVDAQAPINPVPTPIPGINLAQLVNYAFYVAWIVVGIGLARAVWSVVMEGTTDMDTRRKLVGFGAGLILLIAGWAVINSI